MKRFYQAAMGVALGTVLSVCVGCSGNIALMGRPTLQLDQEEIFADIVRVDAGSREIHLRPDDGRDRVVGYSADARVLYRGREYSIAQLERGDKVSMQLKQDSRGSSYTDLIRVQERIQDRNQSWRDEASPDARMQTLDGRVGQLDFQHRPSKSAISPENWSSFPFRPTLGD